MGKTVYRIMTAGLLTVVGVICSLGAANTATAAIAHGPAAVSAPGLTHSAMVTAAVPGDDQWG